MVDHTGKAVKKKKKKFQQQYRDDLTPHGRHGRMKSKLQEKNKYNNVDNWEDLDSMGD